MRRSNLARVGVAAILALAVALPALAATTSEFYVAMLRKGIVAYDAGRYDAATGPLRVAAFGFVDSVDHYQTAHIYLALAFDRLGNAEQARDSARRVVAAERITARYGALSLPADTRANFQALARRSLTEADLAILGRSARNVTAEAQPTQTAAPVPTQTQTQTATTQVPTQPKSVPTQVPAQTQTATTQVPAQTKPVTTTQPPPPVTPPAQTSQATNGTTNAPPVTTAPLTTPPVVEKPAPTTTTATNTAQAKPAPAKPAPTPAKPQPQPAAKPPVAAPVNVAARIAMAEQALTQSRLSDARAIYREVLDSNNLQRADILRVAEGFYRARDFANALRAFEKLGTLRRDEQPYRYYIAVALYETAQYTKAKQELAAVLPFIEETPDVSRYRVKIENAIN